MMNNLLITGGAGFIGSNFVFHMAEKYPNLKIIVLDLLTYAGNLENLASFIKSNRIKFVWGDITDRDFVFNLFKKEEFDCVVNFAAESHVDRSIRDASAFLNTNILGTQVLIDACIAFGNIRFHQISTDEVYGELPLERKDLKFSEKNNLVTSSPYSASKASADLLCLSYFRTYNLPVTISRASNNYGPFQFPEKLIPLVITRALADKDIPVYGDGANIRDWIHVSDHCKAVDTILFYGKTGEIYNIGANSERDNLFVVRTILSIMGKHENLIKFVKDRAGHDRRYAIDSSKAKTQLNWKAEIAFDKGIKDTINWYLENKSWWERIISGEYSDYYKIMYGE